VPEKAVARLLNVGKEMGALVRKADRGIWSRERYEIKAMFLWSRELSLNLLMFDMFKNDANVLFCCGQKLRGT